MPNNATESSGTGEDAFREIRLCSPERQPRILVVDDEPFVLEVSEFLIRHWLKDVTLLLFLDPVKAWEELCRADPDLLITDDMMPRLRGEEIVRRLLDRKVTYPIIVRAAWDAPENWVRQYASQGLNICFLAAPCEAQTFRNLVEEGLSFRRFDYR